MQTKRVISFGLVAAVVGGGAFLVLQPEPAKVLTLATATTDMVRAEVSASGTVQPAKIVALGFGGQGRIAEVNVVPGDVVKLGQVLAALDASAARLDVAARQSALDVANRKLKAVEVSANLDRRAAAAQAAQSDVQSAQNAALVNDAMRVRKQAANAASGRVETSKSQAASDVSLRDAEVARLAAAQAKHVAYVTKRDDAVLALDRVRSTVTASLARRDELRGSVDAARAAATRAAAGRDDLRRALEKTQADLERSRALNPDAVANGVFISDNLVVAARERLNVAERDTAAQENLANDAQRAYDISLDAVARQEAAQGSAQARLDLAEGNVTSQAAVVESTQRAVEATTETARRSAENVTSVVKSNAAEDARDEQTVKQSEATSAQARAAANLAKRQQTLRDQGTLPVEVLNARAEVDAAKQLVLQSQERLGQLEVRAPFDGIVSTVSVKAGEQVGSQSSLPGVAATGVLAAPFTLVDVSSLSVRVGFPDVDLTRVVVGQKTLVTLDALPEERIQGTVAGIEPSPTVVNNVSTTFVRIALGMRPKGLRVGMSASARVIVGETPTALVIPASALTEDLGVLRVRKASPKNGSAVDPKPTTGNTTITEVTVTTGDRNDGRVQVLSGLSVGEFVVLPDAVVSK